MRSYPSWEIGPAREYCNIRPFSPSARGNRRHADKKVGLSPTVTGRFRPPLRQRDPLSASLGLAALPILEKAHGGDGGQRRQRERVVRPRRGPDADGFRRPAVAAHTRDLAA